MAEVTSGKDITVVVLDQREVEELSYLLGSHPQSRFGVIAGLVEALAVNDGHGVLASDLCDECGFDSSGATHEVGGHTCG